MSADTGVGPGHGVGQPGVQRELARLGGDPAEQAQRADEQQRCWFAPREGVPLMSRTLKVCAGGEERDDHAEHEADVADAVGQERLEGGVGVGLLLPPVADQHERTDADELPAHQHLQRVRART